MSCPNYKIVFNDETKYVVQDITEEPVVRVIPVRGEQGPQGPQGEQGPQGPQGEQGIQGEDGKNFEPTVVSELPETGDSSKLYLTPKAHTTQTATGNPIEATITAQAGQLESFQLDGDTFQQTYTGKNLANPTPVSGGSNGVFATYNSQTGEVTVSGTAQTTWSNLFKVAGASYLTAGTYTLKQYGELTNGRLTCYSRGNGYPVDASTLQTTFTTTSDGNAYICITGLTSGRPVSGSIKFQLESGSTASDFEPFVNGQPSPSPEYPQQIQTVTGEQTVKVLEKNLLNITSPMREVTNAGLHITIADDGKITIDGTATGAIWPDFIWGIQNNTGSHNSCKYYFPKALEAVTYSIKIVNGTVTGTPSVSVIFNDDGGKSANIRLGQPQVRTATDINGINRAYLTGIQSGTIFNNFQFYLQIESGTTATEVVPYSSTDYPINLGSIELCKLGTYQDYIYKDSDDWKLHKEIGKVTLDGSETWAKEPANSGYRFWTGKATDIKTSIDAVLKANRLGVAQGDTWDNNGISGSYSTNPIRLFIRDALFNDMTVAQLRGWLATHNIIAYYALATPTDTEITNEALVAQLEAIRTASLENGTNTITNTATGSNLAGDMEIGYYGLNPISRYDEYIWQTTNNSYEQINDTTNYALVQEVVDSLPSTGDSTKLYLVPREYTGKNLLPPSLSRSMGYLDVKGNIYASNPKNEATFDFLKVKPNTTYTFSIAYTTDTVDANYWFGIGAYTTASTTGFISMPYRADTGSNNFATFTTPSNTNYIRISGRYMEHAVCQLEQGYQATDYEPYKQTALNEAYDKWLWIDGAWERMDESKTIEALARNQIDGNLRDLMNFEVGDISAATGENDDGAYQGKLLRNDRIYKFNFSLYIPSSEVTKTTLYTYTDEGEFIREIFPFTNNTKGWFIPANTSFRIRLDYNTIPDGGRPTITDPKTSSIYQNFSIVPFEDYKANTLAKLQGEGNVIDPSNLKYSLRLAIADINNAGIDYTGGANRRIATYDILHFEHDIVLPKQSNFYFYLWTYADQSGAGASGQGWKYLTDSEYVIPAGTYFRLLFVIDRTSTTPLYDIYDNDIFKAIEIYKKVEQATTIQFNPNMRSVAHQGYSTTFQAYGNSRLSSYIGAKKHGFDFGECDIQFSSDGVPVCCHDASFNSNGTTVVIADHTLAELKTYNYYGETIASLDEVVKLCKELGLGLYIDHLNGNWSDAYWNTIFGIVKKYQMQDNVYWLQGIARSVSERILNWYSRAKIVLVISASDLTSAITEANTIKTDLNEVSIDFNYTQVTVEQMQSYATQLKTGVQFEIWTVDNATDYKSYLPYARGITSNKICYNDVYEDL